MLLAAGAVVIERAFRRRPWVWLKLAIAAVIAANGIYLVPITVPVLPPDKFLAYTKTLPFKLPVMEHAHARAPLPQWYADQFGWNEIVAETARGLEPACARRAPRLRNLYPGLWPGGSD